MKNPSSNFFHELKVNEWTINVVIRKRCWKTKRTAHVSVLLTVFEVSQLHFLGRGLHGYFGLVE